MSLPRTMFEYALLAVREEYDAAEAAGRLYDHIAALATMEKLLIADGVIGIGWRDGSPEERILNDTIISEINDAETHLRKAFNNDKLFPPAGTV
jgi:hypothetical protein